MFSTPTLLATLLLALCVTANPVLVDRPAVSLPLSRRLNLTSIQNLVRHDQARARFLKQKGEAKAAGLDTRAIINEPVTSQDVSYIASVGVGSPATTYQLLIDTGSSNTWVGANTPYVRTSTSEQTENTVSVSYGSGSFSGTEFIDQVTLASELVIPHQSIGVASTSEGFSGVDGILGIGPVDLTQDTLSPASGATIPTVTDNLFSDGAIITHSISVSFPPALVEEIGLITWGGTNSSRFTGPITSIPITSTSPSNQFWGIDQSIGYGSSTILSKTAGIVDTGTTLVLIASDAFKRYQSATGAVIDRTTGLLRVTTIQLANMKSLFFTVDGATFELTANAQLWPRALNPDIGGTIGNNYLIVNDLGTPSGEGLDFINGLCFLERFYAVFDTANKRVGLAETPFTRITIN